MPPRVSGILPWVQAGRRLLRDPTAFFTEARRRHGDTFVVDAFGYRLFCVFSPEAVHALYALPEAVASKGRADYALLRHKLPEELFAGRRNFPHHLFGNEEVEGYLENLEEVVALELDALGSDGRFEIFTLCGRLGHRLGLASWAGREAASPRYLDRLIPCFERLDASESFVHPQRAFLTWATGKRRERAALGEIERAFAEILSERGRAARPEADFLDRIWDSFADLDDEARAIATARDVVMIHMGAQSNLYAAMGWTLVNVLARPELLRAVRGGDTALLEGVASESIRLAQRSITLRAVVEPIAFDDGRAIYRLAPGTFVTTMLPVTNLLAAPDWHRFDASRYRGRRLVAADELPARELVSTFGHGRHACPAQRFSISAIRTALARLLERYDLVPEYEHALPLRRQLGAVARPSGPCPVRYRGRSWGGRATWRSAAGALLVATLLASCGPKLVALETVAPAIQQAVRYAGFNNFVGAPIEGYRAARCLLSVPAARALARVEEEVARDGLTLVVFDCYRPQRAVDHFLRWAADGTDQRTKGAYYPCVSKGELFARGYIAERSGHSRGSTVDVTLARRTDGRLTPLDMGTDFDFFDPRSHASSGQVTAEQRRNRQRLREVMERHDFRPYEPEWWHFTLDDEPYADRYFDVPVE